MKNHQNIPPCPICNRPPSIHPCAPWPKEEGPAPWHAGCYGLKPDEHYIGCNGNTMADAIIGWGQEVEKYKEEQKHG